VDGRDECLAWGHDRHLFGDITDTLVLGQVDICDFVGTEEDAVLTVGLTRSDGELFTTEGFWNLPKVPLEAHVSFGGADTADNLAVIVFDLRAWPKNE
jgi:hypothetical protein